jgi:dihydroorotate dehydrogenase electron transfer subunit
MTQIYCPIISNQSVGPNIYLLTFHSPTIASSAKAGQFVNIRISELVYPLLRRPFSVYHVDAENVEVVYNTVGIGTKLLSTKRISDVLDVIGPLGSPFNTDDDYDTGLLVAGGIGVAPLPMLTSSILASGRKIVTFLGARSRDQLVSSHLKNIHLATDDGSAQFHGTVVDLLRSHLEKRKYLNPKMFGCGPTPMLKELSLLADEFKIPCEVSLESAMACGIGLCQGCPVEIVGGDGKYALVCKDGAVFDLRKIRFG